MHRFLTCTLGLACLAQLGVTSTANAAAPASSDSTIANIDYSFYGNDPVLVRGDADLYSSRYNPSEFEIIVEHEIVNDRQVVCTVHSSVEETRWGSTKFRFPARSYVIYTAPSGQCVTGFRFHMTEQFTDYSTNWKTFEHYRRGRWSWASCWTGPRDHWMNISADGWGDDHGMWWRYYGQIQVATAAIDSSNLQYRGSGVAPGGGPFGGGPFGF